MTRRRLYSLIDKIYSRALKILFKMSTNILLMEKLINIFRLELMSRSNTQILGASWRQSLNRWAILACTLLVRMTETTNTCCNFVCFYCTLIWWNIKLLHVTSLNLRAIMSTFKKYKWSMEYLLLIVAF